MKDMQFRPEAPLVLQEETEVRAPAERVWNLLTRVEGWPLWHRGIDFAALRGELEVGTVLHWRADGMRIVSRLAEVETGRRVAWTLRTLGGRGYQRWLLEPVQATEGGATRVRLQESWEGLAVRLLAGTLRRTLLASRTEWLDELKRRAEDGADGD